MKITLISKNKNYCTNELLKSAKKNRVNFELIDFNTLNDAKKYNNWGDIIIWRSSKLDKILDRTLLFEYLKNNGKMIFNIGQSDNPLIVNKFFQQQKISNYISESSSKVIKCLETFRFDDKSDLELEKALKYPMIEKPEIGSQGNDIRLIKKIKDINNVKNKIYQNFVKNDCDYRVICLGGVVLGCIKRTASNNDFRNNISQGGSASLVSDRKIISKLKEIANEVCSVFNLNLAGIDIIFDQEKKEFYFLEINTLVWWEGFQQITHINVADKIIKYCKALSERSNKSTYDVVYDYFADNFNFLDENKYHFASRLYLWSKNKKYFKILEEMRNEYIGNNEKKTDEIISEIINSKLKNNYNRNEYKLRKEVVDKYPMLDKYNLVLFKFLFSKTIYNYDISQIMLKHISLDEMLKYRDKLINNNYDLCVLSTLGINFLYILDFFLKLNKKNNLNVNNPEKLFDIAKKGYSHRYLKNKYNLQIYFYTHCIINESMFYSKKVKNKQNIYNKMIMIIENIIKNNYFEINLDNKIEFIVCCKILNYKTQLTKVIFSECQYSLSDIGNYLIDKYNRCSYLKNKCDFKNSEHRNVLFLMAYDRTNG